MNSYLIYLSVSNLICVINCLSFESQPITSAKGDNLHLMSSTFQLQELLQKEVEIVQELENYLELIQKEINRVEKYLQKNYENDVLPKSEEEYEDYISHPINAFGVIKRMSAEEIISFDDDELDVKRELLKNMTQSNISPMEDVYTACKSLALIQESYNLKTEDFAKGTIKFGGNVFNSEYKLGFRDKMRIGIAAWNRGWMDSGIDWLQEALNEVTPTDDPILVNECKIELERAKDIHDQTLDRKGPFSEGHRTYSIPFNSKLRKKKKYKKNKKNKLEKHQIVPLGIIPEVSTGDVCKYFRGNFYSICEGNDLINSSRIDHSLQCRFQHHKDPYLRLGPFQLEELYQNPFIVSFKNFMYENEIEEMKSLAANNLQHSRVAGKAGLQSEVKSNTDLRTSKQAWIKDRWWTQLSSDNDTRGRKDVFHVNEQKNPDSIYNVKALRERNSSFVGTLLSERITLATQLSVIPPYSSEDHQIANYGVGGQYGIHYDAFPFHDVFENPDDSSQHKNRNVGNRFATFMAYLSDVQAGGGTVFPAIGVNSAAKKGSALFWLNLDNGNMNQNLATVHGGCPVLVGSKWILNKWIRANDQGLKQKCLLTKTKTKSNDLFTQFRNLS